MTQKTQEVKQAPKHRRALLQGNEAVVEGALAAGMRFFRRLSHHALHGDCRGLRAEAAPRGRQVHPDGGRAGEHGGGHRRVGGGRQVHDGHLRPGFSLKQENIGFAALAEIPCVVVDVQRSGPSTGLPTSPSQGDYMQARWGTHGDHPAIAISPWSVQEAYSETIRCFNLAEEYRVPVILLMDETVGHMREGIELFEPEEIKLFDRLTKADPEQASMPYDIVPREQVPRITPFGEGVFYNITGLVHDNWGFPTNSPVKANRQCTRIMKKIETGRGDIEKYETYKLDDAQVCVVSFGGTARSARAAVDEARLDEFRVGMFRPVTVWPFPEEALSKICDQVEHIVVAELNYGQMKLEVERVAAGRCDVHHIGKVNGTTLKPGEIYKKIREVTR